MGGQGLERKTNLTENTQKIKSESASGINIGEGGAETIQWKRTLDAFAEDSSSALSTYTEAHKRL